MNRKIKFRVFDGTKMTTDLVVGSFGAFYVNPGDKKDGIDPKDSASLSPFNTKYHETTPIMQFTGLLDKNGKEIYEGDVLKNTQANVNIVHWFWDSWCYQNYHAESLPLGDHGNPFQNEGLTRHEVIGNIYENPEFLKTVQTNG